MRVSQGVGVEALEVGGAAEVAGRAGTFRVRERVGAAAETSLLMGVPSASVGVMMGVGSGERTGITLRKWKLLERKKRKGRVTKMAPQSRDRSRGLLKTAERAKPRISRAVTLPRMRRNSGLNRKECMSSRGKGYFLRRASWMSFSSRASSSSVIFFLLPLKRAATASESEPSKKTSRTLERADWAALDFSVAGW